MAHELANARDIAGIAYKTLIYMQQGLTAVMGVLQGEKVSKWSDDFLERLKTHYIKPEFWRNMDSVRSIENKYIDFTSACALLAGYFYSDNGSLRSRDNYFKRNDIRRITEKQQEELRTPMLNEPYCDILFNRLFPAKTKIEDEEREEREELSKSFRDNFKSERMQIEDLRKKRNELFGHPTQSMESLNDDAITVAWYRMIIDFRMFLRDFWTHHVEAMKAYFPDLNDDNWMKLPELTELYECIKSTDELVHECFAVKSAGKSETYKFDRTEYDISKDDTSAVVPLAEEMARKWNTGMTYLKIEAEYHSLHNFMSYSFESQNDVIELGNIRNRIVKRTEQGQPADIEYMDFLYQMCPELNGIYWKGRWGTDEAFAREVLQALSRHQGRFEKEKIIDKLVERIDGKEKSKSSPDERGENEKKGIFSDLSIRPLCQYKILSKHFNGNSIVLEAKLGALKKTYNVATNNEAIKRQVQDALAVMCQKEDAEYVFTEIMNMAEDISTQMDGERERYLRNATDERIASLEFEKELQYVVNRKVSDLEKVFVKKGLFHKDSEKAKEILTEARKIVLSFDEASSDEVEKEIAVTEAALKETKNRRALATRFEDIIIEASKAPDEKQFFAEGDNYETFLHTTLDLIKAMKGFATYISPIIVEGRDKPVILRSRQDIDWYIKKLLLESETIFDAYHNIKKIKEDSAFSWFLEKGVK